MLVAMANIRREKRVFFISVLVLLATKLAQNM